VGIERVCETMTEEAQKETARMIGAKWKKQPGRAKKKTKTSAETSKPMIPKLRPRCVAKQGDRKTKRSLTSNVEKLSSSKRTSARSRWPPMLYIDGMPDPEMT